MMGGFAQPAPQKPQEAPKASEKAEKAPEASGYMDMLNTMFDSGLEVQKGYQKNMEAIFESYMPKTPASSPKP
jgi:hypothetical protein